MLTTASLFAELVVRSLNAQRISYRKLTIMDTNNPVMRPHFGLVDLLGVDITRSISSIAKMAIDLALIVAFCAIGWLFAHSILGLDNRHTAEIVGIIFLVLLSLKPLLMLYRFLVLRMIPRHGRDSYEAAAIAIAVNAGCWFYLSVSAPGLILAYLTNDYLYERLFSVLGHGVIVCLSLMIGCTMYLWLRRIHQRSVGSTD